jgi:hypothetical protein
MGLVVKRWRVFDGYATDRERPRYRRKPSVLPTIASGIPPPRDPRPLRRRRRRADVRRVDNARVRPLRRVLGRTLGVASEGVSWFDRPLPGREPITTGSGPLLRSDERALFAQILSDWGGSPELVRETLRYAVFGPGVVGVEAQASKPHHDLAIPRRRRTRHRTRATVRSSSRPRRRGVRDRVEARRARSDPHARLSHRP